MELDAKIEKWLIRLNGHEGGYTNRSPEFDPGGETKWGISKRSYPNLDIKSLTLENARIIYKQDFLLPILSKDLPDGIAFQLFDFAVHSGIEGATKQIQISLGLKPDGVIGQVTRNKIMETSDSDLVMLVNARRICFLKSLSNWEANHNGWIERIARNLEYGSEDTD